MFMMKTVTSAQNELLEVSGPDAWLCVQGFDLSPLGHILLASSTPYSQDPETDQYCRNCCTFISNKNFGVYNPGCQLIN